MTPARRWFSYVFNPAVGLLSVILFVLLVGNCGGGGINEDPDGGSPDSGSPDGGNPDGGNPDGGYPDGGNPDGGNPDGGAPDGGGNPCPLDFDPTELSFEHIVGETDCPTYIGYVGFSNPSDETVSWEASIDEEGESRIDILLTAGDQAPGSANSVEFVFNCSDTSAFDTVVTFECSSPGDTYDPVRVTIHGDVHDP